MTNPLIRQGAGPNDLHRIHTAHLAQRAQLERILREPPELTVIPGSTAGGDNRKLRGIPAIGRGVQGCIPGTNPGQTR